jgi:adenylosuccinate synthase
VITKLDVLSGLDRIQVCTSYRGAEGAEFEDFPYHQTVLHHTTGELRPRRAPTARLANRRTSASSCRTHSPICPRAAREYLQFIAERPRAQRAAFL